VREEKRKEREGKKKKRHAGRVSLLLHISLPSIPPLTIISRLSSMRSSHGDMASGLTPSSGISK